MTFEPIVGRQYAARTGGRKVKHKILIGTDPELFAQNEAGEFRSVHDIIPGTKRQPFFVKDGAVQVDGVAGEFNTMPASSAQDFLEKVRSVQSQMQGFLSSSRPGWSFVAEPTAWFDQDYFDSLPAVTKMLGCEPDYNAYTMAVNPKPKTKEPFRTGAFHVHIGLPDVPERRKDHFILAAGIVRQLDNSLYLSSLEWDSDQTRRKLYGAVGSFRVKPYGLEYRPLSNAVLRDDDTILRVYDETIKAVSDYLDGVIYQGEFNGSQKIA